MKIISMAEFEKICNSLPKHKYIIDIQDQEWEDAAEFPVFTFVFDNMLVWNSPPDCHAIKFSDEKNILCFFRIREIAMKETFGGIRFVITCGKFLYSEDIKYTVYCCIANPNDFSYERVKQ